LTVEPLAAPDPAMLKADGPVVRSMAFAPDGQVLAVAAGNAGDDRFTSVALWDTTSTAQIANLQGHQDTVWSVAYRPDGKEIATGSLDNTVRLWDPATGTELARFTSPSRATQAKLRGVLSVAYFPSGGDLLVGAPDGVWRWEAAASAAGPRLDGLIAPAAVGTGGRWLVARTEPGGYRVIDAASGATIFEDTADLGLCGPEAHPHLSQFAVCLRSGQVRFVRAEDGDILHTLDGHPSGTYAAAFSGDGAILATVGVEGTDDGGAEALPTAGLRLWRTRDGAPLGVFLLDDKTLPTAVAISPDNRWLAVGSTNAQVLLWPLNMLLDTTTGAQCPAADADPDGYLRAICIYLRTRGIDVSPGRPDDYAIKAVESGVYNNRPATWVFLTCCYMGDIAIFDPATGQIVDFRAGAQ
jgi:WD40 repeat protein